MNFGESGAGPLHRSAARLAACPRTDEHTCHPCDLRNSPLTP